MGHHRPASEKPLKWRFVGGPNTECWLVSLVVLQGIRTNIAKKPHIIVFLRGSPDTLSPSGSAHAYYRDILLTCQNKLTFVGIEVELWPHSMSERQHGNMCLILGRPNVKRRQNIIDEIELPSEMGYPDAV